MKAVSTRGGAPLRAASSFSASRGKLWQRKSFLPALADSQGAPEREADRVADLVVTDRSEGAWPTLSPVEDAHDRAPPAQRPAATGAPTPRTNIGTKTAVDPNAAVEIGAVLAAPGRQLDGAIRSSMESRFNADFSAVRIHSDSAAAHSARTINARAYTIGADIVFGAGEFAPEGTAGKRMLAHELAHTLQQSALGLRDSTAQPLVQRRASDVADVLSNGSDSDVDRIVIDPGSRRTRFYTRGGTTYDGQVLTLVSTFVGDYVLKLSESGDPRRTWDIYNPDGSSYRGALQFEVRLDNVVFESLTYTSQVKLSVTSGVLPRLVDIEQRLNAIKDQLRKLYLDNADELALIGLLDNIPAEQTAAFVKRLREETAGEQPLLERLDAKVGGENNIMLHQVLSRLKLSAGGVKTAAALVDAPTLAWHDVMGFVEQAAVFSVTRTSKGTYRIRYLKAVASGLYSNPQFAEVSALGSRERTNIVTGGIEVAGDQPIIVHDYDANRTVLLTAEDLIAYQHAGVRKFLQDVGTIASLATPLGGETAAAKILAYGLQIASAATLIVDESKLTIRKWFPNWGPAIVDASEKIKIGVMVVGLAQLVKGGWTLFTNLRRIRNSRGLLDAEAVAGNADELIRAENEAAEIERRADELLKQAELARKELGLAEESAEASPAVSGTAGQRASAVATAEPRAATTPAAGGTAKETRAGGSAPPAQAALPEPEAGVQRTGGSVIASGNPLADINAETRELFKRRPDIKKVLEDSPHAARALKRCTSPCFPEFASRTQIDRLERLLEAAEDAGVPHEANELTSFLRSKGNWMELEQAIDKLEKDLTRAQEVVAEFAHADLKLGRERFVPEGHPRTTALRVRPGTVTGGAELPEIAGQWFPQARDPQRGAAIRGSIDRRIAPIPGQIAKRMRGLSFRNFDEFREMFWQLVARDPKLRSGWSAANLRRMEGGLAPVAPASEHIGGRANRVYQLHHIQALKNFGEVYDLDNIEVVGPAFHAAVGD